MKIRFNLLILCLLGNSLAHSVNKKIIKNFCLPKTIHPFKYDLALKLIPAARKDAQYMICCHGSGANNKIADSVKASGVVNDHIISFNFPDHDQDRSQDDPKLSTFGTIEELLPLLYIIKKCVIEADLKVVNLYGFSAGGGVIVNVLSVLSNYRFANELKSMGINPEVSAQMLQAIQNGLIILECPLKSMEEIAAFRGTKDSTLSNIFEIYSKRYKENNLRPIDSICSFKNLKLNILLHFEIPDDKLSNRDDQMYIDLLKKHNLGTTHVVIGHEGGHCTYHKSLWDFYKNLIKK